MRECGMACKCSEAIACQRPLETISNERINIPTTKQHNVVYSIFAHNSLDIMRMYGFDLTWKRIFGRERLGEACGIGIYRWHKVRVWKSMQGIYVYLKRLARLAKERYRYMYICGPCWCIKSACVLCEGKCVKISQGKGNTKYMIYLLTSLNVFLIYIYIQCLPRNVCYIW